MDSGPGGSGPGPAGSSEPPDRRGWVAAGVVLLGCCLGWTLLSSRFLYGEGHAERPILSFLLLYWLAWGACLFGFLKLRRAQGRGPTLWILLVALSARLLLLNSSLIQENDVYRYVLDGQVLLNGENPFRYSPLVVADLAGPDLRKELNRPEAREVLRRVGYPAVPTLYPPAAQATFALGAWLGDWSWRGQRWVFSALDLVVGLLILHLLPMWNLSRNWVVLYAWNPLVLKEVINSAHVDVLAVFWLLVTLACAVRSVKHRTVLWSVAGGAALGLAILSKLYPVIFLPSLFLYLRRNAARPAGPLLFLLTAGLVCGAGLIAFLSVGFDRLTAGLIVYAGSWVRNAGVFSLVQLATEHARAAVALAVGLFSLALPWLNRDRSSHALIGNLQWVGLFWFLMLPAPFPWYALFLAALLPLRPLDSMTPVVTMVLCGSVALYYLSFLYEYRDFAPAWWLATRALEHFMIWAAVTALVLFPPRVGLKISRLSAMLVGGRRS